MTVVFLSVMQYVRNAAPQVEMRAFNRRDVRVDVAPSLLVDGLQPHAVEAPVWAVWGSIATSASAASVQADGGRLESCVSGVANTAILATWPSRIVEDLAVKLNELMNWKCTTGTEVSVMNQQIQTWYKDYTCMSRSGCKVTLKDMQGTAVYLHHSQACWVRASVAVCESLPCLTCYDVVVAYQARTTVPSCPVVVYDASTTKEWLVDVVAVVAVTAELISEDAIIDEDDKFHVAFVRYYGSDVAALQPFARNDAARCCWDVVASNVIGVVDARDILRPAVVLEHLAPGAGAPTSSYTVKRAFWMKPVC